MNWEAGISKLSCLDLKYCPVISVEGNRRKPGPSDYERDLNVGQCI
jgi:hypothetical protein